MEAIAVRQEIDEPMLGRIAAAIDKLEWEPPEGDSKKLRGRGDYRLGVGGYRILFRYQEGGLYVTNIASRGGAYKE